MKNDSSAFVEWFERERDEIMDRIFKVLGEKPYEGLGCGLVMELHQQALTAAAEQIAYARANQKGSAAAIMPFSGYKEYRYSIACEGPTDSPESPAQKKRRGPGRKHKDIHKTGDEPQLFPATEGEPPSTVSE